jgi:hypothetical protein
MEYFKVQVEDVMPKSLPENYEDWRLCWWHFWGCSHGWGSLFLGCWWVKGRYSSPCMDQLVKHWQEERVVSFERLANSWLFSLRLKVRRILVTNEHTEAYSPFSYCLVIDLTGKTANFI